MQFTIGLEDFGRNKYIRTQRVPSMVWLLGYLQQCNNNGLRALALIHGGNNDN